MLAPLDHCGCCCCWQLVTLSIWSGWIGGGACGVMVADHVRGPVCAGSPEAVSENSPETGAGSSPET
eukprot:3567986-Rhodomonas_salina.1